MYNNVYFNIIICSVLFFAFYKIAFIRVFKEIARIRYLKKNGVKTVGKVIDIESSVDLDGLKMYRPIIEYTDVNNKVYILKPVDSKMSKYSINSVIPVTYDPDDPNKSIINDLPTYRFAIFKMIIIVFIFSFLIIILFRSISYLGFL